MSDARRTTGLERLPDLAETDAALAGLAHDLTVLDRPHLSGPGVEERKRAIRASMDRLLAIRALRLFLADMGLIWPEPWPAWSPEVAVLDIPLGESSVSPP